MFAEILLLLSFSSLSSQTAPAAYEDVDAYEVFNTILPTEWPSRVAQAKRLVVRSETKTYQMCLRPEAQWEEKVGPAISDYLRLNQKPWLLQPRLSIETPYEFMTPRKFRATLDRGGWDGFYRQYPGSGGLIELSAVGFNRDKTVAVVYIGHGCGMRCGGGTFHVLEKKDGKWSELDWKGARCSWVS
jgi:hypothetical protein